MVFSLQMFVLGLGFFEFKPHVAGVFSVFALDTQMIRSSAGLVLVMWFVVLQLFFSSWPFWCCGF